MMIIFLEEITLDFGVLYRFIFFFEGMKKISCC